ncbi:MAG TPA: hypothetical protein VMF91_22930 [Bryobacteraceae bacterium]|nr:hypothetical protein [Bryobacteraceae bacterium]
MADLPINLVDSGGVRREKQLLPDFFGSPVCDGIDQRVQDSVPSLVVYSLDSLVLVQLRDHVGRRIEVVQNGVAQGKRLELGLGYLCA